MKKLLLVVMAVLMTSVTFAQFSTKPVCRGPINTKGTTDMPTWTPINTMFTLVDLDGDTINYADTLAAGKAVVIDYSATWCSWCWVMHTNGILEALHNQLGSSVSVAWIEADASTSTASIYGGSGSQGDWTNGGTVPYPIIDNANAVDFIGSQNIAGYPTVIMISPGGYWCDLYGTDWGFGPYSASEAVTAVSALLTQMPSPNTVPAVEISGFSTAFVGSPTTYAASIISVDDITNITWTITNGNPATASNVQSVTTTWNNPGTEMVIVSVTNTTGTTIDTLVVNVQDGWEWGDEMSYCGDNAYATNIGTQGEITWGVKFPSSYMNNRNYLENVKAYITDAANYTLKVYQTTADAPATSDLIYQHSYRVSSTEAWYTFNMNDVVALDNSKDLWVTLTCTSVAYPAAAVDFCGDPNGSYVYLQGNWYYIFDLNPDLNYTWMINATTSATPNTVVSIDANEAPEVALYPNPTTSVLNIEANGVQEVSVVDLSGRTVMTQKNTNSINMSDLANGVYYVRVITNNGVSSQKVVKK